MTPLTARDSNAILGLCFAGFPVLMLFNSPVYRGFAVLSLCGVLLLFGNVAFAAVKKLFARLKANPCSTVVVAGQQPTPAAPENAASSDLNAASIKLYPARHFDYYSDWKTPILECPQCHWKGRFEEGAIGYYKELMDCSCPKCDFLHRPILAIVSYPTVEEMRRHGSPGDVMQADLVEQFRNKFQSQKLMNKEQLPDIEAPSFTLTWDFDERHGEKTTVIRYGDQVLFSESALWEGYERFEEVCEIVRDKYGARVVDLVPTPSSELYLYGDVVSSPHTVRKVRQSIFGPGVHLPS